MKNLSSKSSNKLFETIFSSCSEGLLVVNRTGIIQLCNKRTLSLFGYSNEDELIDQPLEILIPEALRKEHKSHYKNYTEHPSNRYMGVGLELFALKKDGNQFPVEISLSHTNIDGNHLAIAFISDITKRKEIEEATKAEQEKYKAVIETAIDGIITIDMKGIIQSINPAVENLFQYNSEELIGQNINILMPQPYHSHHNKYIGDYLRTGKARIIGIGREVEGRKKDGTVFPFNLSISEIKIKGNTIFTGIIHDLTAQKEANEKLSRLNSELEKRVNDRTKELADLVIKLEDRNKKLKDAEEEIKTSLKREKELNELKSRFVSMASHEFRTPLSTILSSTSLVDRYEGAENEEKRAKHINRIKSNVRNLTSILNDFLSLDKLEEGQIQIQYKKFDLQQLGDEIIEELTPTLKNNQSIEYNHSGTNTVCLDQNLTKNITLNLLSNAIKYSSEGSIINLMTIVNDNEVKIIVQDHGIGIPEEDQEHMFTRFFRAKNVTNIQGTGLGLSIVQRYAELMNGSIDFVSEFEKGSTFTVKMKSKK